MVWFSSRSQQCFLNALFNELPEDAHPLTPEEHQAYQDGQIAGKVIDFSTEPPSLIERPPVVLSCIELCARIDQAADNAREKVAGDPLRAVEYQRSADQAQAFKDAGYPAEAVPPMVAAWAISGRTAQQSADSILAEANAYYDALTLIRTTRLAAKEQVRALMADAQQAEAETLASATVAAIQAAVAGIGNNVDPNQPVEPEAEPEGGAE